MLPLVFPLWHQSEVGGGTEYGQPPWTPLLPVLSANGVLCNGPCSATALHAPGAVRLVLHAPRFVHLRSPLQPQQGPISFPSCFKSKAKS